MLKQQKCILTLFFLVILQTLVRHVSCKTDDQTTTDQATTDQPTSTTEELSEELTEGANIDIESLLDLEGQYGRYTPQEFSYVNWQHHYEDEMFFYNKDQNHTALIHQRCNADFVKCLSNLEIPHLVCAYFWLGQYGPNRYKYFQSYCHVFLENCLLKHRRYRMINYGGCFLSYSAPAQKWEYPSEEKDMNTNPPV